ncbi:MAG TPA: hypothetical protein VJY39_23815 [Acidisphaera sp.]|nr:hypothetical protein [Acidisphaera sp.]
MNAAISLAVLVLGVGYCWFQSSRRQSLAEEAYEQASTAQVSIPRDAQLARFVVFATQAAIYRGAGIILFFAAWAVYDLDRAGIVQGAGEWLRNLHLSNPGG